MISFLPFRIVFSILLSSSSLASFNSPCQLPSAPSKLIPFCQFPYHQVPFICDPGGILSRTEAELIDRRLWPNHNLTGCLCLSRPCAQKDRQNGKIRALTLLVQNANIEGIRKCTMEEKGRQNWEAEFSTEMNWRRKRGTTTTNEFASLAGQFGRLALDREDILGFSNGILPSQDEQWPKEWPRHRNGRIELAIKFAFKLVLYIDRWGEEAETRHPFIVRIFRRNLAQFRDLSQVERVDRVGASPFEILLDQLGRALTLVNPKLPLDAFTPKPAIIISGISPSPPMPHLPKSNQIPSWAIISALFFVFLALFALILAHWIGRRISLVSQKKFSTASRMSTRSTRTEDMQPMHGKGSGSMGGGGGGHSLRGMVTFGPGTGGAGNTSASHLKSQMMFRQFSRKTQQPSIRTVQTQKI